MCRPQAQQHSIPCIQPPSMNACSSPRSSSGARMEWMKRSMAGRTVSFIESEIETHSTRNFMATYRPRSVFRVARSDIALGDMLGQGSFSNVHDACPLHDDASSGSSLPASYAIKQLREDIMSNRRTFHEAAANLFIEGELLSRLNHPNIIKLHGVARGGVDSFGDGNHDGFFLLLDRLDETLSQRINRWRNETATNNNDGNRDERLNYALQLASSLEYLHDMNLIFRDLKPDNIGFMGNTLQLFDFGLCRELPTLDFTDGEDSSSDNDSEIDGDNVHDSFEMSGVGSRRYMAPEVAMCRPYNQQADVYSFGVLLFEMMTLKTPFDLYSPEMHHLLVCEQAERPAMPSDLPEEVADLIEECWAQDPRERPSMQEVVSRLQALCNTPEDNNTKPYSLRALSKGLSASLSRWLTAKA